MRHEETLSAQGVEMLAYWRLADTEAGHAFELLQLLALPLGARVVDLGSGTGALARCCQVLRPDMHWTLVNVDAWQLSQSPEGAQRVQASMIDTGLAAGEFDAVVVAYALGYANPAAVLREARRLLADGGKLVLHELYAAHHATQAMAMKVLGYRLAGFDAVRLWAELAGFDLVAQAEDAFRAPGDVVRAAAVVFDQFDHGVSVFRAVRPDWQHGRSVALQFSGGKDSMALLYLLRPYVELGLPVYWTHTGDTIPETLAVIDTVRSWVPDFRVVQADVLAWKSRHGIPSDVTTAHSTFIGQQYAMTDTPMVGRFDCCWANLMQPMHQRMLADGIDAVIRGTKLADTGRVPANGHTDSYEVILPLNDWSHEQVFAYLEQVGAPCNAVYAHFKSISAPECLHCSAWWDDGKAAYLKQLHPDKVGQYRVSLQSIRAELSRRLLELDSEIQECAA